MGTLLKCINRGTESSTGMSGIPLHTSIKCGYHARHKAEELIEHIPKLRKRRKEDAECLNTHRHIFGDDHRFYINRT